LETQSQEPAQDFGVVETSDAPQDDDVMLAVPEAPRESLAQIHYETPHARPHMVTFKSLGMRQVAVPVLLTVGLMFAIAGVVKLIVGEDSPLYEYGNWLAIVFFVVSAGSFGLGLLNMMQLRAMIRKRAAG
jgi:hypothetical protein